MESGQNPCILAFYDAEVFFTLVFPASNTFSFQIWTLFDAKKYRFDPENPSTKRHFFPKWEGKMIKKQSQKQAFHAEKRVFQYFFHGKKRK